MEDWDDESGLSELDLEVADTSKRVDVLACEVVGHKKRVHRESRRGETYEWAYCHRCGEDLGGQAPPMSWLFEDMAELENMRPATSRFVITGITDSMLS